MSVNPKSQIVVAAFLALHLLPAYWRPFCVWGGDLLAFYPMWVQGLFVILSVLLLIPAVQQGVVNGLTKFPPAINPWESSGSFYRFALLLLVAGGLAFLGLRSAVHLLGDGYLLLRDLPLFLSQDTWKGVNAPFTYWGIGIFHRLGSSIWNTTESTYRIYSYLSGGLYLLLTLPAARTLGRTPPERTLILGFLLTPGFVQLFFGYVETYAILLPAVLLYLTAGVQVLRRQRPLYLPALLLGILVSLHLTLVAFAPSLIVLAILHVSASRDPQPPGSPTVKAIASLAAAPLLVLLIFTLIGFHPLTYLKTTKGTHLLPLLAQPDGMYHYRIFSPAHLLDLFNHYLLVAPSALIVLCLLQRGGSTHDPARTFLFTAALFPVLFTLVANPEIGAFRDWDAFAYPGLPLTLWAALALIGQTKNRSHLIRTGLLVCTAAALHSLLWIGLNAREASAEARFADLLERTHLSAHARSYGWETLGSYYRVQNQTGRADNAYRQALAANPKNPRHWSSVGMMYHKSGQVETALHYYQKAIDLKPDHAEAYSNMGNAYSDLGQQETALHYYRKAIDLYPDFADVYYNMGNTYYRLDQDETALHYYQKAINLKPDHARAYYNMGVIYYNSEQVEKAVHYFRRASALDPHFVDAYLNTGSAYNKLGQYKKAIQYYQKVLAIKPDDVHAYVNMGTAYRRLGQTEKTKTLFRKVLELNPNHPQAAAVRKWLRANP